jgi:enoyl-CoA hydratase
MNTNSPQLERDFHLAIDEADADSRVRAIVVTGAGKAFCAGADMGYAPKDSGRVRVADPGSLSMGEFIKFWQNLDRNNTEKLMRTWRIGTPVIAAVNGWALGFGMWLALTCDITIASERAVFGQPEVRHVSNSSYLMAALCGWKVANRYTLTGDHFDAQEAYRIGMINEVVPHDELMPTARKLAERIALVPEASVRINKGITMLGTLAAGLESGILMNIQLSSMAHSSYGPERERLLEAQRQGGVKAFIEMRDGPFRPEPFGPKSARP